MSKNILGIVGSYRRGGTVDQTVEAVLASAAHCGAKTEKVHLLDREIGFCTNCRQCTQPPGEAPGPCPLRDDMSDLIARLERADALVLGAPVNFGGVNALTQRFLERLVPFAYWPWDRPAPAHRRKKKTRKAVLVTSAAMPAPMGRLFTGSLRGLKLGATALGCRTVGTLFVGTAGQKRPVPRKRTLRKAEVAGRKLVRG